MQITGDLRFDNIIIINNSNNNNHNSSNNNNNNHNSSNNNSNNNNNSSNNSSNNNNNYNLSPLHISVFFNKGKKQKIASIFPLGSVADLAVITPRAQAKRREEEERFKRHLGVKHYVDLHSMGEYVIIWKNSIRIYCETRIPIVFFLLFITGRRGIVVADDRTFCG